MKKKDISLELKEYSTTTQAFPNQASISPQILSGLSQTLPLGISDNLQSSNFNIANPQIGNRQTGGSQQHISLLKNQEEEEDIESAQWGFMTSNPMANQDRPSNVRDRNYLRESLMRVFGKKELEMFLKSRTELDFLMEQFDDKVVQTLNKQEFELLKSFQITMDRMTFELSEAKKQLDQFNLAVEIDFKVQGLEKQLRFFRENCNLLNKQNQTFKTENTNLKNELIKVQQDYEWSKQAHINTQKKLLATTTLNTEGDRPDTAVQQLYTARGTSAGKTMSQTFRSKAKDPKDTIGIIQSVKTESDKEDLIDYKSSVRPSRQLKYRDSLQTAENVILLQDNIQFAAGVIDQLLVEKITPRDELIEQLKDSIVAHKAQIRKVIIQAKLGKQPDPVMQEVKQIFLKGVTDVQQEIQKRQRVLNPQMISAQNYQEHLVGLSKFMKYDRIEVISKFFSSMSFLEAIKAILFSEPCCQNPACKFNIDRRDESQICMTETEMNQVDEFYSQDSQYPPNDLEPGFDKQTDFLNILNSHQNTYDIVDISRPTTHQQTGSRFRTTLNSQDQKKRSMSSSHQSTVGLRNGASIGGFGQNSQGMLSSFRETTSTLGASLLIPEFALGNQNKMDGINYHKLTKQRYLKQKKTNEEINDINRKFHKFNRIQKESKMQDQFITGVLNSDDSRMRPNTAVQQEKIDKKESRHVFKNNKIY